MITFQRIFQTREQAMDVYKSQLSSQKLYVESFEGYSKGTEVSVSLEIRETSQKVVLRGSVERLMGKKEVMELGFGQRPGLLLSVPITPDVVEPLRAFFLAQAPKSAAPKSAESSSTSSSRSIPLENITQCSAEEAVEKVRAFLQLANRGNLYMLFNVPPTVDRQTLRRIYNVVVRTLHPDAHDENFSQELSLLLGEAYQVFNEAYQILQHPIKCAIYMEVSRQARAFGGMSLNAYKKWQEDYRMRNASNIRMSDELVAKAEDELAKGDREHAAQNLQLALQYDPFNENARSVQI